MKLTLRSAQGNSGEPRPEHEGCALWEVRRNNVSEDGRVVEEVDYVEVEILPSTPSEVSYPDFVFEQHAPIEVPMLEVVFARFSANAPVPRRSWKRRRYRR